MSSSLPWKMKGNTFPMDTHGLKFREVDEITCVMLFDADVHKDARKIDFLPLALCKWSLASFVLTVQIHSDVSILTHVFLVVQCR